MTDTFTIGLASRKFGIQNLSPTLPPFLRARKVRSHVSMQTTVSAHMRRVRKRVNSIDLRNGGT